MNDSRSLLSVMRIVDKDVVCHAELIKLQHMYIWTVSIGSATQNVMFTGDAESPIQALSQLRNLLVITADVTSDILVDVKSAIAQITDDCAGLEPID